MFWNCSSMLALISSFKSLTTRGVLFDWLHSTFRLTCTFWDQFYTTTCRSTLFFSWATWKTFKRSVESFWDSTSHCCYFEERCFRKAKCNHAFFSLPGILLTMNSKAKIKGSVIVLFSPLLSISSLTTWNGKPQLEQLGRHLRNFAPLFAAIAGEFSRTLQAWKPFRSVCLFSFFQESW